MFYFAMRCQICTASSAVTTWFWQRVSIDIQRAGHRAFMRRAGVSGGVGLAGAACGFDFGAMGGLEIPGGGAVGPPRLVLRSGGRGVLG